ncbi:GGT5 hydrolase, partial [Sclerurus mexicanus]|nr:GGT5 hydrolase [Sclerurus mexicanus]
MPSGKVCCLLLLALAALALAVTLAVILAQPRCGAQHYLRGAAAADSETCSVIARNILKSGGTAVDAAIAGLICTSVVNPQSSGLGGGVIFTIYNASTGTVEVINARETAPGRLPPDLLSGCGSGFLIGPRWIAVPGELRGYEEAHKRHGRLPWKALFEPTLKLLSEPLVISPVMDKIMHHSLFSIPGKSLCPLLCDGQRFLKRGETFRWPALQQTLRAVAEHGAAAFYEGQIGKALVQDIRKAGSSVTLEDLRMYRAEVSSALNVTLNDNTTVFAPGPPMGGAVLMFVLKVLEEYKLREASLATPEEKVETYHLIAEALKFGNMLRPHMSDPAFSKAQETVRTMLSDRIVELVRHRIDARGDHPLSHYSLLESIYNGKYKSMGTSHISVLAADGSAVSATSTINYPFGSFVYSNQTGIILNNELADFCIANRSINPAWFSVGNTRKVREMNLCPSNPVKSHMERLILSASALGEKPPSAMVPSILISKTGDMLVIGGAGGAWIISATTMAIINKLWFGYDLEHAISAPVMHTDGDSVLFEDHFSEEVKSGLLGRGHKEKKDKLAMNVVQGISKEGKCISAYSDERKLGKSAGY